MWRQFPFDIFERAPNQRSAQQSAYILLMSHDREQTTVEVFQRTDFTGIFRCMAAKLVSTETWDDTQFKRYFPPKGFEPPRALQNFRLMKYYRDWNALMLQLSVTDAERVRQQVFETFKTFKWLPLTGSDRMWATKKLRGGDSIRHLPSRFVDKSAPQIAINP
ncbi:hypothetical protein BC834DRAFT_830261 [Gloeopeniophorella convolvens]|nr:hypothetical protein BC834DRAFT_830261 [Gloeopeniophorella convolvens]